MNRDGEAEVVEELGDSARSRAVGPDGLCDLPCGDRQDTHLPRALFSPQQFLDEDNTYFAVFCEE